MHRGSAWGRRSAGLTTPAGTFVDGLLVYKLAGDHFMLVVNAGNIETK